MRCFVPSDQCNADAARKEMSADAAQVVTLLGVSGVEQSKA
jgi:hypothetical protein